MTELSAGLIKEYIKATGDIGFNVLSLREQEKRVSFWLESQKQDIKIDNFFEPKVEIKNSKESSASSIISNTPVYDEQIGLFIESETQNLYTQKAEKYTPVEQKAMRFLIGMLGQAQKNMQYQEDADGAIAWVVNVSKEAINHRYAKSNVKENIEDTKKDVVLLKKTARGEIKEFNAVTGQNEKVKFGKTFEQQRGVKFSQENIDECESKAQKLAEVQACDDVINALKKSLYSSTSNTVNNAINQKSANKAIIKSFQTVGIKTLGEMNKVLEDISNKHKNHPLFKKYGGDLKFSKDKNGDYVITRKTPDGRRLRATTRELGIIADDLVKSLSTLQAQAYGCEIPKGATNKEIEEITQNKLDEHKKEYEDSFAKAYGEKDLKALSEKYMESQEKGVAYVEMGVNILAMAGAMFTGGGTLALVSTGAMIANPTRFIEMATDKNGMTKTDWKDYGQGVAEQMGWMALGMGAGKVGDMAKSFVKVKGLAKLAKQGGKNFDDFMAMMAKSPDVPADITKALKTVNRMANSAGITTEVALDIATTSALQKDGATKADWIMSIGGALVGTKLQKHLAPMGKDAQVKHLQKAFKDVNLNEKEALQLLKALDDAQVAKLEKSGNIIADVKVKATDKTNIIIDNQKEIDNLKDQLNNYEDYFRIDQFERKTLVNSINSENHKVISKLLESKLDGRYIYDGKALDEIAPNITKNNAEFILNAAMEKGKDGRILYKESLANLANKTKNISKDRLIDIVKINGFDNAIKVLTGKTNIFDIGLKNYEAYNAKLFGSESPELKVAKEKFQNQTGIEIHIDNNCNLEQLVNIQNDIKILIQTGREIPKRIYVTNIQEGKACGEFERRIKDVVTIRPKETNPVFDRALLHEAVHLADINNKKHSYTNQFIKSENKNIINNLVSKYAAYNSNEFIAEFGVLMLKGDIQTNVKEGKLFVKVNENFTNLDGKKVEMNQESINDLNNLVEYYYSLGGPSFNVKNTTGKKYLVFDSNNPANVKKSSTGPIILTTIITKSQKTDMPKTKQAMLGDIDGYFKENLHDWQIEDAKALVNENNIEFIHKFICNDNLKAKLDNYESLFRDKEFLGKLNKDNQDFAWEFINQKNSDGEYLNKLYELEKLLPHITKDNADTVLKISSLTNNEGKKLWFNHQLEKIVPNINKDNSECILKMCSLVDENGNSKMWDSDITQLAPLINKDNTDAIIKFTKHKLEDGSLLSEKTTLYSSGLLIKIINNENIDVVLDVLSLTNKDGNLINDAYDVKNYLIPRITNENKSHISDILKLKDENGDYLVSLRDTDSAFLKLNSDNKELFVKMIKWNKKADWRGQVEPTNILNELTPQNKKYIEALFDMDPSNKNNKENLLELFKDKTDPKNFKLDISEIKSAEITQADKNKVRGFLSSIKNFSEDKINNIVENLDGLDNKYLELANKHIPQEKGLSVEQKQAFGVASQNAQAVYQEMPEILKFCFPNVEGQKVGLKHIENMKKEIQTNPIYKEILGDDVDKIFDTGKEGSIARRKLKELDRNFYDNNQGLKNTIQKNGFAEVSIDFINNILSGDITIKPEMDSKKLFENKVKELKNTSETSMEDKDLLDIYKMLINTGKDGSEMQRVIDDFKKFEDHFVKNKETYLKQAGEDADRTDLEVRKTVNEDVNPEIAAAIVIGGSDTVIEKASQHLTKLEGFAMSCQSLVKDHIDVVSGIQKLCNHRYQNGGKLYSYDKVKIIELSSAFCAIGKKDKLKILLADMNKNGVDINKLNNEYFKSLAEISGLTKEQVSQVSSKDFENWDLDNINTIGSAFAKFNVDKNTDASSWLKDLIKTSIEGNYKEYMYDPKTKVGQANRRTKDLFELRGIDYDKWMNYQGAKTINLSAADSKNAINAVHKNFSEDLAVLLKDRKLGKDVIAFIAKSGYEFKDGMILSSKTGKMPPKNMRNLSENLLAHLEENKLWDEAGESALTIKNHLNQRIDDVKSLNSVNLKDDEVTIKLWKRQAGHDLFQGTYCQCCVALDGINSPAIVEAMVNTSVQVAEMTNKQGNTIGKILLYWAKDSKTGEKMLVCNGAEIATGYQQNDKIRNLITDYMKNYAKETTGKDVPLYTGQSFQDIKIDDLEKAKMEIDVIGQFTNDKYYFDSIASGVWTEKLKEHKSVEFLKLSN